MKTKAAKAFIANNIVDGSITQLSIGGNEVAWMVYKTKVKYQEVTQMVLFSFSIFEHRKPHLSVLGHYSNYSSLVTTDLHSTKLLVFDPDP